jgi:hypothetical protein
MMAPYDALLFIGEETGRAIANAALQCLGVPFRLHGRDLNKGLDCVGVALHALGAVRATSSPPNDYNLRGPGEQTIRLWAKNAGLLPLSHHQDQPGDIVLVAPAPGQSHLLVLTGTGFVHAHLGVRKTIAVPGAHPWPVRMRWRLCAG